MMEAILRGINDLSKRVDGVVLEVGKLSGLPDRMADFVALMEKVEERAAGDVVELKKAFVELKTETALSISNLAQKVAKLEGKDIANTARNSMVGKLMDGFFGRIVAPVCAAVIVAYFVAKGERSPTPPVTIQAPAAIVPMEPRQGGNNGSKENSTRRS